MRNAVLLVLLAAVAALLAAAPHAQASRPAGEPPLCPDGQRSYFGKCPTGGPAVAPPPAADTGATKCNRSRAPQGPADPCDETGRSVPPRPTGAAETFQDCPGPCPTMVPVPAGSAVIGSDDGEAAREGLSAAQAAREQPRHRVTIAHAFAVSQDPITFAQWDACLAAGGCAGYQPTDLGWGRGRRPVIGVSWSDAQAYVAWLSQRTGQRYRLLSEAEFEYAARAGTTTARYWGDAAGTGHANCRSCGARWDRGTAPAGSFPPNPWGLRDMLGNAFTWTEDCWAPDHAGAPADGSARRGGDCSRRVVRGGGWHSTPVALRAAYRWGETAGGRFNNIGFRVARALP